MMHLVQIDNNSPLHAYAVLAVCSAAMRCKVTLLLLAASFSQHVRGYCTEVWVFFYFFQVKRRIKKEKVEVYMPVCMV